jgi:chloride channel protein, CIC family
LPLLVGGITAHFLSSLLMRNSIMTEKIARRGINVSSDYGVDLLDQVLVRDRATPQLVTLSADRTSEEARAWTASGAVGSHHQGFPIVDEAGHLVGVLTLRDLGAAPPGTTLRNLIARRPVIVYPDSLLRTALDQMVLESVGRVVVVERADPRRAVGILTRSDLLGAHTQHIEERAPAEPSIAISAAVASARRMFSRR